MNDLRYERFHVSSTTYKVVDGHELKTYIFVPKDAPKGKRPVYVKFHGGYLVLGSSIYPPWMCHWTLDYVHAHAAIIVAPDHRLMPEATGVDIAADMSSFWAWLFSSSTSPTHRVNLSSSLTRHLADTHPDITPDLARICCTGASAGGYLAVQSAFRPDQAAGRVRALIGAYPMLDVSIDFFAASLGTQHPMGMPTLPDAVLDEHLARLKPGEVVSAADPPQRAQLAAAIIQRGRWRAYLGGGEEMEPMRSLESVEEGGEKEWPFMFLFHGLQDRSVPVEGTVKFAERLKERAGEQKCYLYTGPGDHGLDIEVGVEEGWMKEGLERVTEAWLGE